MTDEELSISDATLIARLREDVFYGDERLHNLSRHNPLHMEAADRIEALVKALSAAKAYIENLEDHEGAEGFSTSTSELGAAYYTTLKGN